MFNDDDDDSGIVDAAVVAENALVAGDVAMGSALPMDDEYSESEDSFIVEDGDEDGGAGGDGEGAGGAKRKARAEKRYLKERMNLGRLYGVDEELSFFILFPF